MPTLDEILSIAIAGDETEWGVSVDYTYHSASRGSRDRFGVPLEPDEPAICEIDAVTGRRLEYDPVRRRHITEGEPVNLLPLLSPSQITALETAALREHQERMVPEVVE